MNTVYLIIALAVLAGSYLLQLISARQIKIQRYLPLLNGVQFTLWTILVFWAVHIFYSDKSYYSYLIIILSTILILLIVWFYVKDIVAGFLFRIGHNPLSGQILEYGNVKGTIKKIGMSFLKLELSEGKTSRIPYSILIHQPLSLQFAHTGPVGRASVTLKVTPRINSAYLEQQIRQTLVMSSWCIASKPVETEPSVDRPGSLKVTFYLIDPAYLSMAEDTLHKLIDQLNSRNDNAEMP